MARSRSRHTAPTIYPVEHRAGPLDGFRGLAVTLVVLYHLQVRGVGGGLLGVDIFFVLSGYLITGLLLQEWRHTSSISLSSFWARRARRLLPALILVLIAVAGLWRFLAQPAEVAGVRDDVLATLFYVANWHSIIVGHSYFAAFSAPSPLLHTWSLAVEEQFYLFWPIVVLGALVWRRSVRLVLLLAVAGTLTSAVWMAFLSARGADPSRLYFGTDTRAQTVLIGAALAVFLHLRGFDLTGQRFALKSVPRHSRARRSADLTDLSRRLLVATGTAGLAFIVWACLRPEGRAPWLYRGGLLALGLACDAVLAAIVLVPRSWLGRVLAMRPLRLLGLISYGVYLIHWPVIVGLSPTRTGLSGWSLDLLQATVTLVLAVASFAFVELPIRERRLRIPRPTLTVPATVTGIAVCLALVPIPSGAGSTLAALAKQSGPAKPPLAPAALLAPTTTAPPQVLAPAISHPGPLRAMIEGDSVAWSLGNGIAGSAESAGFVFANEGYVGCGIATGGATSFTAYTQPPSCLSWPQRWQSQTDTFRPDVTFVLLGRWELVDRVHNGVWMHIGQPAFDQYLTDQLETVVHVLTSDGGRVGFLTSPCNDLARANAASPGRLMPDDATRVLLFNELLARIVAAHPGITELVPFRDLVCPGGQYEQTLNGATLRTSDGVHMEGYAGQLFVQRIWPEVATWLLAPVFATSVSGQTGLADNGRRPGAS